MSRWYERIGIALAFTFGVIGMVLAQYGLNYQSNTPFYLSQLTALDSLALLTGAALTVSFIVARFQPHSDQLLLPLITFLGTISLLFLYRLPIITSLAPNTFPTARIHTCYGVECRDALFVTESQALTQSQSEKFVLGFGVLSILTCWSVPLRAWQRYRSLLLFSGFVLLIITALIGREASPGGPRVSLDLGFFDIQPAELVKLLLVGYVAGYLSITHTFRRPQMLGRLPIPPLRSFLPLGVVLLVSGMLLGLMQDLGAALILLATFPVLFYLGISNRVTQTWLVLIIGVVIAASLLYLGQLASRIGACPLQGLDVICRRIEAWRDPFATAEMGGSTQQLSGIYALGAGGIWGQGLGLGFPKGVIVPVIESDMIYVGVAEDLGIVGMTLLLGTYLLFLWRGIKIARRQTELYSKLLAGGIVALFGSQLFIIVGGILGLIPLTGIPLPFISAGGSAVVLNLMAVGVLLRLSAIKLTAEADPDPNRRLLYVGYLYSLAILLLWLGTFYWMVIRAGTINPASGDFIVSPANPPAIQRLQAWARQVERGTIRASDGTPLAITTPTGRTITDATLTDLLGTVVPNTQIGATGLEASLNDTLLGKGSWDPRTLIAQRFGGSWQGFDVRLTIDPTWQSAAANALAGYEGAVIVLSAESGDILAVVSHAAAIDRVTGEAIDNHALQQTYPPGSTFKTVVAAIALETGISTPERTYLYPESEWDLSGAMPCHFRRYGGYVLPSCNTPDLLPAMTLNEGYSWSDNVMFADLALEIGPTRLMNGATHFGFGDIPPLEIPASPSVLTTSSAALDLPERLALTGIGQQDVRASPLQMALVAAAILNNGVVPRPRLIGSILTANGDVVQEYAPESWRTAISSSTATRMVDIMRFSAQTGWARYAAVPSVDLGGKTGTAEWGDNTIGTRVGALPHSWYHGFAIFPSGERVAFAVIIESGGDGSGAATTVTRLMLEQVQTER